MTHTSERKDGWIYMTHKPDPSDWDYDYLRRKAMSTEQDPDATSQVSRHSWPPLTLKQISEKAEAESEFFAGLAEARREPHELHDDFHEVLATRPDDQLSKLQEKVRRLETHAATLFRQVNDLTNVDALQQQITAQDAKITELTEGVAYLRRVVIGSIPKNDNIVKKA